MDPVIFLLIVGFSWLSLNAISRTHWFDVKNPEIGLGYAFYRTTKLNNIIDRLAKIKRGVWKFIWDVGVISGLGILIVSLIIFTINIPLFFQPTTDGTTSAIALTPVIPGITISFQTLPYFLIAIMISAIVHEFAHGIAARVEEVDLKSTGIFIFLVLFGAFVESDEKSLAQKSRRSKIRIMAAGALANMVVAGILILILIIPVGFPLLITPLYDPEPRGTVILEIIPNYPASLEGMKVGYAIIGINSSNGYQEILSYGDFRDYSASSVLPNQTLTFYFDGDIDPIVLRTDSHPDNSSKGFIGIRSWDYFKPRFFPPFPIFNLIPYWSLQTILYVFMINFILAIMNLLPVPFLDGDKLLTEFLGPKFSNYLPWIRYYALGVLGINLLLSFYFMGWQQI